MTYSLVWELRCEYIWGHYAAYHKCAWRNCGFYFWPKVRFLHGQCLLDVPIGVAGMSSWLYCMVRIVKPAFLPPRSLSELSHRQFSEIFFSLLLLPLSFTGVTSYKSLVLLNPQWCLLHERPKLARVLKRFQTKMKQCVSSLKEDVSSWLR